MGYESKFIVGDKSSQVYDGKTWVQVYATFDVSKMGYDSKSMKVVSDTPLPADERFFFYADDGNTMITEDRYDEPLKSIDYNELLLALRQDEKADPYRRFGPFIAFLETIISEHKFSNLIVLHYGH